MIRLSKVQKAILWIALDDDVISLLEGRLSDSARRLEKRGILTCVGEEGGHTFWHLMPDSVEIAQQAAKEIEGKIQRMIDEQQQRDVPNLRPTAEPEQSRPALLRKLWDKLAAIKRQATGGARH